MATVTSGCQRLLEQASCLRGRPYGLLAHGASITVDGRPLHLALAASAAGPAAGLFGPEHGYYGIEQDMVASRHETDPWTGAPILSLYGDDEASLRPSPKAFDGLAVLIIDLQDVGSRYYTYVATAVWAAEAALEAGVEVWILDRPNPLGGEVVEGNRISAPFHSFVGAFDTPVRHGLTLGELVSLEARRRQWPDGWKVWTMEGWRRAMTWRETGLPWVAPSPNMPTLETAAVYPGGCLIEATDLSEGRGTTRPFQLIGAPGVDPVALTEDLNGRRLPGIRCLPTYFRPQFQKHSGVACGGLQLILTDSVALTAYRLGLEILAAFRRQMGDAFSWRRQAYEFVDDRPAIDLLTGSTEPRRALESGDADALESWMATWGVEERSFDDERRSVLLYG